MAVRYLDDLRGDGTCLGQTTAALISFYGSTPAAQKTGGASTTIVVTNSSATSLIASSVQELQTANNLTMTSLRAIGLLA